MTERRDAAMFSELVEHRSHALLRTAYLMVGDRQLAEDLLQEALIKAYMAWPRLREHDRFEAYVRRTIVTTSISWRRRRSFHERPSDALPERSSTDPVDGLGTHQVLLAHLRTLPPRQRAAIVLRFYDDLSVADTADVMGCSPGTVKSHVSIGLAKLRERMGADLDLGAPENEEVSS